ncbi:hypothetical protein CN221_28040 [Sinorhizobium meliloti]|nr:hypothetical protein [Sinorhizobium meliloti]PST26086.1 hypothetical protein C7U62_13005 [Mesorhizobium loti]RVG62291.1 hypothetical protein CN222_22260 [Sinorhizobium meliloti]RVG88043.1 hypothetical protein CN221_28040 [Sinorhizobium meliloti]RVG97577.1 hypothetical protein CN218_04885 [Sinorhizobium meliloti]
MNVDTSTFPEEVLKSAEPVLVNFSIEGCAPGEMIAPGLEQINAELAGKVKVAKLDIVEVWQARSQPCHIRGAVKSPTSWSEPHLRRHFAPGFRRWFKTIRERR